MVLYDLISKEYIDYHITGHRGCFIGFGLLSIILGVFSFFSDVAFIFFIMMALVTLFFFLSWNLNKQKYGKKLSYYNGTITIYNHKNEIIKEFAINSKKNQHLIITFEFHAPRFRPLDSLIFYDNMELYEKMEYSSYWKESELVIIQNPELIDMLDKILAENN